MFSVHRGYPGAGRTVRGDSRLVQYKGFAVPGQGVLRPLSLDGAFFSSGRQGGQTLSSGDAPLFSSEAGETECGRELGPSGCEGGAAFGQTRPWPRVCPKKSFDIPAFFLIFLR